MLCTITFSTFTAIAALISAVRANVESNAVCDEESLLVVSTQGSRALRAYADSSPWGTTWTGTNCGHGGQQLGGGENKQLRYEQCFNLCVYTDGCSCFVSGPGLDNMDCYLLSSCKPKNCEDADNWTTTVIPGAKSSQPSGGPLFPFVASDNSDPVDPSWPPWAFDSANLGGGQGNYPEPPYDNNFSCGINLQPALDFDYRKQIGNYPESVEQYLASIYGHKAVQESKVQMSDNIRYFWNTAPLRKNITIPRPAFFACFMLYEQPFTIPDGNTYVDINGKRHSAPGFWLVQQNLSFQQLPKDNVWIEVAHVGRLEDHTLPEDIASVGQMWYWMAPGSGIWLNVGKTKLLDTAGVDAQGGCPQAIKEGYDTVINRPLTPPPPDGYMNYGGMVEVMDCRGAKGGQEANFLKMWEGPCPPPGAGALRTGLPELGEGYSWECGCDRSKWYLNCEGA